ncbi:hypothetical protein MJG53_005654 [Ovis ammon polii x Ovis aries]|uniref:Uncharacterized protein n=1 Tax=Ovis ammon polii x Ovis aries TaxID=2918886 RepID=A0ACB9V7L4_9CETA|nr:hypothetical protein MJG53_005654 [Ovis ammon polii x Ovis aries]
MDGPGLGPLKTADCYLVEPNASPPPFNYPGGQRRPSFPEPFGEEENISPKPPVASTPICEELPEPLVEASSPSQPAPPLPRAPALGNSHCWGTGFRKRSPFGLNRPALVPWPLLTSTSSCGHLQSGKPCEKTPLGYPSPGLHPEGQRVQSLRSPTCPPSQASLGMGPGWPVDADQGPGNAP